MNRIRAIERVIFIVSFFIMISSLAVFADDHVHDWNVDYIEKVAYNQDQHKMIIHYYCGNCDEKKEEFSGYEDHDWYENSTECVPYNKDKHKIVTPYDCSWCQERKEELIGYENHNWLYDYDYGTKSVSDKEHAYKMYCYDCYETETIKEKHSWEDVDYKRISDKDHSYSESCFCGLTKPRKEKHDWVFENYKKVSDKEHSCSGYCSLCYATTTRKEKHHFDQYNHCKDCETTVANNITLKPGVLAYSNGLSWIKIIVSKNGYLRINSDGYWDFYDTSKKKVLDVDGGWCANGTLVPVKKGTYYIRTEDACDVKYTFFKDPSKKNYTKKKAQQIKRKKAVVAVIYANAKKKTWKRYFKIKLKKAQFLHLKEFENEPMNINYREKDVSVSDIKGLVKSSKNKRITLEGEYDKSGALIGYISKKKLKKGTYYICLSESYSAASKKRNAGVVYSLYWY